MHEWDPLAVEPTPSQVIYWMRNKIDRLGSSRSIGSWQSAISFWCKKNLNYNPKWIKDGFYNECYRAFEKLHSKQTALRDPLQIEWMVNYFRKKGVTPSTWTTVDVFILKECFLLTLTFFSISRPFELTFTNKTENEMWEIITTGLKWGDISLNNMDKPYLRQYLHLLIHWYKNQIDREIPKDIWMSPPICNDSSCLCHQLDYIAMYKILKARCIKFHARFREQYDSPKISKRSSHKYKLCICRQKWLYLGTTKGE